MCTAQETVCIELKAMTDLTKVMLCHYHTVNTSSINRILMGV